MDFMKLDLQLFASGTISLGTNGYLTGQILWSSTSNGTNANSSNVTATLQLRRTNSYTTTGTWTGNININGNSANYSYYSGISSSWVTVFSRTVTVPHNADGTKVCYIGGSGTGPTQTSLEGKTVSNGVNVTLDKIPRQASITGAPNFNDESNPTITYSNPAGNSVSSLQACISLTGAIANVPYRDISKTGTSYTFNLTETERNTLRNSIPNATSRNVTFFVKTVIAGTTYYSTLVRTFSIVNANPTFDNFEFNDVNTTTLNLTGNSKNLILGYSNVEATISSNDKATANKGASMSKYRFTNDTQSVDINYSDSENVTGTINKVTSGTNNVYAIDSRNNTTLVAKLANEVINYEPIYIDKQSTTVTRNNSNVGTGAILNLEGTFWNSNFGQVQNSIQNVSYTFKKTESSSWIIGTTPLTLTIEDNTFSFNGLIASNNQDTSWDIESSYNVRIVMQDKLSTNMIDLILNSAIPTLSFDKEGVGIMCAYDPQLGGLLQVGGQRISAGGILTAQLLNDFSLTPYWNDIPFDREISATQDLELENNNVVIKANVNKVLVSGACTVNASLNYEMTFTLRIINTTSFEEVRVYGKVQNSNNTCTIPPTILNVSENDSIKMDISVGENCTAKAGTYITVQIIS